MSSPQIVNVRYRGLELGAGLKLVEFGPTTAYLEFAQPMPVGTVLSIEVEGGMSFDAQVLRVREQVAGAEHEPGMRVRASLSGDAKGWWKDLASGQDPVIPALAVNVDAAADDAAANDAAANDAAADDAAADDAAADDAAVEAAKGSSEGGPEKSPAEPSGRHTAVMDVSEIQAVIAAGGDVADLIGGDAGPAAVEGRPTLEMSAVDVKAIEADAPAVSDDSADSADDGKKKKKKRRRKRKN